MDDPTKDDVFELNFDEVELRVLAHMRQDAEKMDRTDEFKRPTDLDGFDTAKVRTLLSLKDAQSILEGKGPQTVDVHKKNAADLYGISEDEVTPEQREFAKTYGWATMYNADSETLQELVDRDLAKAQKALNES